MQSTNELFHAAQQQVIEEERCSAERDRNETKLADWYAKGGPERWVIQVIQDGREDLLRARNQRLEVRRHA